jgi:hypothetical protein
MPLNEDPDALTDAEYWALVGDVEFAAASQGERPCSMAVPVDVLAAALERLDDQADYQNGAPPSA